MKILFVCRQNIGRSQMAAAFYNHLTDSQNALSCGTNVDLPGQTLAERKASSPSKNWFLIDVMNEKGIDVSQNTRRQITPAMLEQADIAISMAEPEVTPDWLTRSPKYRYWDVPDPKDKDLETTRVVRDDIEQRIEELLKNKKPQQG